MMNLQFFKKISQYCLHSKVKIYPIYIWICYYEKNLESSVKQGENKTDVDWNAQTMETLLILVRLNKSSSPTKSGVL